MSSSVATRAGTQVTALPPAPPGTETPRGMNGGGSARDRSNAALVPQSEGGKGRHQNLTEIRYLYSVKIEGGRGF